SYNVIHYVHAASEHAPEHCKSAILIIQAIGWSAGVTVTEIEEELRGGAIRVAAKFCHRDCATQIRNAKLILNWGECRDVRRRIVRRVVGVAAPLKHKPGNIAMKERPVVQ